MRTVVSRVCRGIPGFVLLNLICVPAFCQTSNVLTIDDAVKEALANNRLLNSGALDIDKSVYAADAAHTAALPVFHINATGGALLNPIDVSIPAGTLGQVGGSPFPVHDSRIYSANSGVVLFGASLTQPLTTLPGIRLNNHLQEVGVQLSIEEQRGRRISLAADVKKTYYEIVEAQDSLDSAQQALKADDELTRTVADFVAQKTALQADLLDAQAQSAQQQLKVVQFQDQIADAKERLNDLIGRDLDTQFEVIEPEMASVSVDDLPALRATALAQRSDLREAALRVKQAALGRQLANTPNVPIVSAVVSYDRVGGNADIGGLPDQIGVVGLQLDWTPIDWGRHSDTAKEQDLEYKQAKTALDEAKINAVIDVDTAVRQYREAIQAQSVAQLAEQAATERLREMTNQYGAKSILLKDLMQQQAASSDAADKEQLAVIQLLAARTGLEVALGDDE